MAIIAISRMMHNGLQIIKCVLLDLYALFTQIQVVDWKNYFRIDPLSLKLEIKSFQLKY